MTDRMILLPFVVVVHDAPAVPLVRVLIDGWFDCWRVWFRLPKRKWQ